MPIRKILALPIEPNTTLSVLASAHCLARSFGGHVDVIHVKNSSTMHFGLVHDGVPANVLADMERAQGRVMQEAAEAVRGWFDAFVERSGVAVGDPPTPGGAPSFSWSSPFGNPAEFVAAHGGAYDLIVIGRPSAPSPAIYATIEAALYTTGRPVLLAPPEPPAHIGERVMIAWNRGTQGARAFHAAKALILKQAARVRILSIVTGAKQGPSAAEIADNLSRHGIEAEVREMTPDSRAIGVVLLAEASATNADLLVMGAFSNSRLRQLIFGGVTRHVLENAELPVMMAY